MRQKIIERLKWFKENALRWRWDAGSEEHSSWHNPNKPLEDMTDEELLAFFESRILSYERNKYTNLVPDH